MSLSAFALTVLLLLLTPGPTNTLLAISSASRGLQPSLPLIVAELSGYLTTIVPLVFVAAPLLAQKPLAALTIKLASTLWVLFLAVRLWTRPPSASQPGAVSFAAVYGTTLLNPKGLIIGLALIPAVLPDTPNSVLAPLPYLAVFSALVVIVATCWLGAGAAVLRRAATANPMLFGRIAASFLVVFAITLASRAIGLI